MDQKIFITPKDHQRFWWGLKNIGGCWEWQRCRDKDGYGFIKFQNRQIKVHRLSWMMHKGQIPKGIQVLHGCDNPPCARPAHLFLGTSKDNVRDMDRKKRRGIQMGELNHFAKLNVEQIHAIRALRPMRTCRSLAIEFGVSETTIYMICDRRIWKHVTP